MHRSSGYPVGGAAAASPQASPQASERLSKTLAACHGSRLQGAGSGGSSLSSAALAGVRGGGWEGLCSELTLPVLCSLLNWVLCLFVIETSECGLWTYHPEHT